jgi:hypothetical protein
VRGEKWNLISNHEWRFFLLRFRIFSHRAPRIVRFSSPKRGKKLKNYCNLGGAAFIGISEQRREGNTQKNVHIMCIHSTGHIRTYQTPRNFIISILLFSFPFLCYFSFLGSHKLPFPPELHSRAHQKIPFLPFATGCWFRPYLLQNNLLFCH